MTRLKCKHIYIAPEILEQLNIEAAKRGITANELVREACMYHLTHLKVDRELSADPNRNAMLR